MQVAKLAIGINRGQPKANYLPSHPERDRLVLLKIPDKSPKFIKWDAFSFPNVKFVLVDNCFHV